jgi:hypothetical protein
MDMADGPPALLPSSSWTNLLPEDMSPNRAFRQHHRPPVDRQQVTQLSIAALLVLGFMGAHAGWWFSAALPGHTMWLPFPAGRGPTR